MINEKMRKLGAQRSVIREIFEYGKLRKAEIGEDKVFDFSLGNPSVPAPSEVNSRLTAIIAESDSVKLHGYTSAQGDFEVRRKIADHINSCHGESVNPDCIYMTVGAAGALTCALTALVSEGEEVVIPSPYFPEYRVFVERCGGVVRRAACNPDTMELDVKKIEAAITEKCAAIIINSPNNPTGKVYSEESIISLCNLLRQKEKEYGRSIYLISDEPYRELIYGDITVPYLTKYYNDTVISYSFSKSLSIPGERIGYLLVSPKMTEWRAVYEAVCGAGRALGFVCAPSLLQRLVAECLDKTADISVYAENRRILLSALTEYGYECISPDGAFYLFVKTPTENASEFCERAKEHELLLVPSDDFGCGGYVRIAYCVSTEQIKASLPAFKALIDTYKAN